MRRRWIILAIAGVLLLSGCGAETGKQTSELSADSGSAEDTESKGSTQNNMSADSSQIHITDVEIPLDEGESLSCYTVDNGVIYYAVELPTGNLEINPNAEFTAAMEKEIRSYNWNTKEEELLYKYAEGMQIDTSDMGVCGNLLYWEDYPREVHYRVMGLELHADNACAVLFDAEDVGESSYIITPENDGENIYFYSPNAEKEIFLYTYQDGVLTCIDQPLFVNSAYEHPAKYKDEYAVAFEQGDQYVVATLETGQEPEIYAESAYVALQQLNDKYITYVEDLDSRNQIYVIDRANGTQFMIETEYFFNYGLLGEFLIINLSDQVISVNLVDGEKNVLLDSCDWYGWIFNGGDETLSLESRNHIYIFELE